MPFLPPNQQRQSTILLHTITGNTFVTVAILALPTEYAEQGLCNGLASSVHQTDQSLAKLCRCGFAAVCPAGRRYQTAARLAGAQQTRRRSTQSAANATSVMFTATYEAEHRLVTVA